MEQPEIEFIATEKFRITQTGNRLLQGLRASWIKKAGTFQSGKKNSELFGEAVQPAYFGSLYIDVSDDSLSFTGRTTILWAFTMGAYFWGPASNNVAWFIVVPHSANFTCDLLDDGTNWRVAMGLVHETADYASLAFSTSVADVNLGKFEFSIPTELRGGWIHLAFTYNPNESAGPFEAT